MKKRIFSCFLLIGLALIMGLGPVSCSNPTQSVEMVDPDYSLPGAKTYRSVVAITTENGVFLSWRLFLNDPSGIGFNVYRNGVKVNSEILGPAYTDYLDTGNLYGNYQIEVLDNGQRIGVSEVVHTWADDYLLIPLDKPTKNYLSNGVAYDGKYNAYDAVPGDLTGNGIMDLVIFWSPENEQDSANAGRTGNVYVDAYSLDGTKIWGAGKHIDLGPNIRAGNHDQSMAVADFADYGLADIMVKTAPLTVDTAGNVLGPIDANGNIRMWTKVGDDILDEDGNVVNQATYRYSNSNGYVLAGEEYLSIFNGRTGEFMDTIWFPVPRNVMAYGTTNPEGNRTQRFTAGVANMGGPGLSAFFQRGYYTGQAYSVSAIDFDGENLDVRWIFCSDPYLQGTPVEGPYGIYSSGSFFGSTSYGPFNVRSAGPYADKAVYGELGAGSNVRGQGNHQNAVAIVDECGLDSIFFGSLCLNWDGKIRWNNRKGHGDAMHLAKHMPDRPGLQILRCYEDLQGIAMTDADTGEIIWEYRDSSEDVGRCMAADIDPNYPGNEVWAYPGQGIYTSDGVFLTNVLPQGAGGRQSPFNFAIYWSGNTSRNLLDGGVNAYVLAGRRAESGAYVTDLVKVFPGTYSNAGSKQVPMLVADLFGDFREETVYRDATSAALFVTTSTINTVHEGPYAIPETGIPTLMDSHQYAMQILGQHSCYNQPSWPEWFIGHDMEPIRK